jgi:hypothetical protein
MMVPPCISKWLTLPLPLLIRVPEGTSRDLSLVRWSLVAGGLQANFLEQDTIGARPPSPNPQTGNA